MNSYSSLKGFIGSLFYVGTSNQLSSDKQSWWGANFTPLFPKVLHSLNIKIYLQLSGKSKLKGHPLGLLCKERRALTYCGNPFHEFHCIMVGFVSI